MKLLFDQNLSYKLVQLLADVFPGSTHVRDIGLDRADDAVLWEFAKAHGFVLVSKDDDFHQRSFLFGAPPKVVWLRVGNCSTSQVEILLRTEVGRLELFGEDAIAAFCTLGL